MNKVKIFFLFYCLSFYINSSFSFQELDKIIAIVNKEPITQRDLEDGIMKAEFFFQKNKIQPPEESVIQKKVLDELIEKKLLELYAQDWNINVSQEDIDTLINSIIQSNNITLEEFKLNLNNQNITFESFIDNLKYEILLKKIKSREISSKLNISDFEIQKHKEKLSKLKPDIYNLSHILLKFPTDPSAKQKNEKRELGKKIYQMLQKDDFAKVAYEFSDAPDSNEGGLLGELNKNELPEIFINELNNLKSGEISKPFESNNGIHIIKINSIKSLDENNFSQKNIKKYFVKQIVIRTSELQSENDVINKLKKIINEIKNGGDFETLAKKYSEDFTSANGGTMGWISEGIDKKLDVELSKIDKNEVSNPFQTNNGWHIIQYTDSKIEDLRTENFDNQIKMDLINERTELLFDDWLISLKAEAFIEIRNE